MLLLVCALALSRSRVKPYRNCAFALFLHVKFHAVAFALSSSFFFCADVFTVYIDKGQDSRKNGTSKAGKAEQDRHNKSGPTGGHIRTARTGLPRQGCQDRIAQTGLPRQDCPDRAAKTAARTGLLEQDSQNQIGRK